MCECVLLYLIRFDAFVFVVVAAAVAISLFPSGIRVGSIDVAT